MKELKPSSQFKKDLKRFRNKPKMIAELMTVLELLKNEKDIPDKYRPHLLKGDYSDCMECHILGDFLLIWIDPETDYINLVRLGSHSELFGKGQKR